MQKCEIKHIPVIPKKDLVVTCTLREGPFAGQVCEAQLTLPDGRKVHIAVNEFAVHMCVSVCLLVRCCCCCCCCCFAMADN